ncbi:hypothetical protein CV507_02955 [Campylobacter coli]|nr:hypothetical protein [Campylobacter coli]EIT8305704.1 hypothetical protein [Campylobacter coli]
MKVLLLSILALPLFAVELISYNIYDRNDRVDLMLSFDSAYGGKISQKKEKNLTLLTLSDLKYSKEELKSLNSGLVDKISISSKDNNTYIMLQNKEPISLELSSINDKFGVRIRAVQQGKESINPEQSNLSTNEEPILNSKKTSLEGYDYTNYILVMLVLFVLLIVLWWLKRTLAFKNTGVSRDFRMVFQRFLDKNNQLIVFEYASKRYTMIVGNSNIVLEEIEIPDYEPKVTEKSEKNFDSFFKENKKRIQSLIEQRQKNKKS